MISLGLLWALQPPVAAFCHAAYDWTVNCKLGLQVDFAFFFLFFLSIAHHVCYQMQITFVLILKWIWNWPFHYKFCYLFFSSTLFCKMTFKTISSHELGYNRFSIVRRQKSFVLYKRELCHTCPAECLFDDRLVMMPTNSVLRDVWSLRFHDSIRAGI